MSDFNKVTTGISEKEAVLLWFTGLSGAGKTTIAKLVEADLREQGKKVAWLDGDVTREYFPQTGFSKEDRDAHVMKAGFIAKLLVENGVSVIASYIAPYAETRDRVRNLCPNYKEVYVSTSLDECERRDVKGLYAKVRSGEIKQFTGIDDPYEPPTNPEINIQTEGKTPEEAKEIVINFLKEIGYLD